MNKLFVVTLISVITVPFIVWNSKVSVEFDNVMLKLVIAESLYKFLAVASNLSVEAEKGYCWKTVGEPEL